MHLSFPFRSSGGAAHTVRGGGWLGGAPVNSGKTTPQLPYGLPALLLSSKGICFHSAECTEYKQAKGSHIPLYLNTSCCSHWQTHQCQGPCRDLPMFHLCPQSGDAMLVHFLSLFSIPFVPMPSPVDSDPQH